MAQREYAKPTPNPALFCPQSDTGAHRFTAFPNGRCDNCGCPPLMDALPCAPITPDDEADDRDESEEAFQRRVWAVAERCGWRVYHTKDSRGSPPGFPDLVLINEADGDMIFAELKREGGRVSRPQREWIDAVNKVGEVWGEIWRPSDAYEIAEVLGDDRAAEYIETGESRKSRIADLFARRDEINDAPRYAYELCAVCRRQVDRAFVCLGCDDIVCTDCVDWDAKKCQGCA